MLHLAIVLGLTVSAFGQSPSDTTYSMWSVEGGYSAMKDQLNVGLVYDGVDVTGRFAERITVGNDYWEWGVQLGIGALFSRGMTAIDLHLEPWDFGYLWRVVDSDWQLYLGPGITGSYRTYVNPELHSGSFFWYTHYDLQLRIAAEATVFDQRFRAALNSTVASLASRPTSMPDPYFYNWEFLKMMDRAHSNMTFGSLDVVQHTDLQVEWWVPGSSDLTLSYVLTYDEYTPAPSLTTLRHAVRVTWY